MAGSRVLRIRVELLYSKGSDLDAKVEYSAETSRGIFHTPESILE